jgi:hypothetical protein
MRKLKPKRCRQCKEEFIPWNSTQVCCDYQCAIDYVKEKQEKNLKRDIDKAKQAERREIKRRKEKLKSKSDWTKEAQAAANAYTREVDKGEACISCGLFEHELNIKSNVVMVCGHYLSVGAHPELRFHDFNRNLQCTRCNGGAGKYGNFNNKEKTVTQNYRVNLIKKIGLENVEWLEGPQQAQNLTIDDIKDIKQYYREQLKILKSS